MTAEVIQLGSLDENDEAFVSFLDELKTDNARAVFIIDREDGRIAVGSNAEDRGQLVFALFRLQKLIEQLVLNAE